MNNITIKPAVSAGVLFVALLALAALWPACLHAGVDGPDVAPELREQSVDGAHYLGALDWVVIAVYALGMLAIGWYYSRQTQTTEDYLLGGRRMNPVLVGLSLFATLFSAFSFLAWPGEMIRYGPTMWFSVLAYPLIYLVVGWLLIPFIMHLRVTTAYEILEIRLGLSVRMLGAAFFLCLRLFWMALITYATADKILVPISGLNPSATPYFCVAMGLITVIYTSMGGLRAVVITDVIQAVILFGGAIAAIGIISWDLGGIQAWWPAQWPTHWPDIEIGYDPTARATVLGATLAVFTWYVCTSGSDQMSVQRYLATRDTKAARRMLATSLAANFAIFALLGVLGLALLAFFHANPHALSDGQTVLHSADRLFPIFIASSLPAGCSGLIVAGLLAAAMSSLSAGINASCSVITVDFIDRFSRRSSGETETHHMKRVKYLSVLIGLVVVTLSTVVGMVQGSLLELGYKVANLLVSPLFGLFFMAMFVRWATALGTILGAIAGVVVAVGICYSKEITGAEGISFLWAMPLSLLAQVVVGAIASFIPLGRRRPPSDLLAHDISQIS